MSRRIYIYWGGAALLSVLLMGLYRCSVESDDALFESSGEPIGEAEVVEQEDIIPYVEYNDPDIEVDMELESSPPQEMQQVHRELVVEPEAQIEEVEIEEQTQVEQVEVEKDVEVEVEIEQSDTLVQSAESIAEPLEVEAREQSRVFDRGINTNPFIYRGEFVVGAWASHGSIDSSSSQMLLLLNDISGYGQYTAVDPYLGYTYRDNRVVGVRFGFTKMAAQLNSATIDLGESNDLSFDIPYLNYSQQRFDYGLFHRSYAGLDSRGRFALFADVDLSYSRSSSLFEFESGGDMSRVRGESWGVDLNFNPGVAVYIMPNVSGTLCFGLGGLNYSSTQQYDFDGAKIGEAEDSKLSLKFNILAINIGVNIHLWRDE